MSLKYSIGSSAQPPSANTQESQYINNQYQYQYQQQQQQQQYIHHQQHQQQQQQQLPPPNYDFNIIQQQRKRTHIQQQAPIYIPPKVCKSPVVIHNVKSKYVNKATPQAASIPLQPLPSPLAANSYQQYNTSNKIYSQQQLNQSNYSNNSSLYYNEPQQIQQQQQQQQQQMQQDISSYSFHDMNQVLSKLPLNQNQTTNESHNTSVFANSVASTQPLSPIDRHNFSLPPYLQQHHNVSRLSNTVISDIENINSSLFYGASSGVDSFLSHDKDMNIDENLPVQQLSFNQHRQPPPPYPGNKNGQNLMNDSQMSENNNNNNKNHSYFVRTCSPQAFKFFMEQHIENIFKQRKARDYRRMQLENEMLKAALPDEEQDQMRKLLCQKETNYIRLKRAKMNKLMFETIKLLGNGAFGEVNLVRKIDTGRLYAMKTLHKTDVFNRNQAAHVKAERDILAEADNEWVVKLYYSFQDEQNLYFVMDYIPGGDLMNLLIKLQIFNEDLARFYIAELVCAIESVHNLGFIHRDIKPDNILIDKCGHIKLTDFGLCTGFHWTHSSKYYNIDDAYNYILERKMNDTRHKLNNNGESTLERKKHQKLLAHSLVGTPNYIAPEILSRKGYTKSCDWWSVGVILYEMLVGEPPFRDETSAGTQQKVINWRHTLKIPDRARLSEIAKDLIYKLCTDEEKRLGNNGAYEIKAHQFFNGIDFTGNLRKTKALYIPPIKYPTDTSNFEPIEQKPVDNNKKSPEKDRQINNNFCILNNVNNNNTDNINNNNNNHNNNNNNSNMNSQNENNSAIPNNLVNNPKNTVFYEFTFRRFFDEAYLDQIVQSDSEDNEQLNYFNNNKNLIKNYESVDMSNESHQRNSDKDKDKDDQPAIYV